jgi:hypothetical protein
MQARRGGRVCIYLDVAKVEDAAASPAAGFPLRYNKASKDEAVVAYRKSLAISLRLINSEDAVFHLRRINIGFPSCFQL